MKFVNEYFMSGKEFVGKLTATISKGFKYAPICYEYIGLSLHKINFILIIFISLN